MGRVLAEGCGLCKGPEARGLATLGISRTLRTGGRVFMVGLPQAFAEQTLRTLCLAYKEVAEDAYKQWEPEHQEAALLLQNRAQALHHVYNKMEQNLQVAGPAGRDPPPGLLAPGSCGLTLCLPPSCWEPRPLKTSCRTACLRPSDASRRGTLKCGC